MADYKKMQENIKLICERVSMGERMAMLAEETAELADAAQLLLESITESRRRGRKFACGRYASEEVEEEIADVLAVMLCTFDGETIYKVLDYSDSHAKPARSAGELKKRLRELIALSGIVRYVAFKRRRIGNKENPTDWRQEQAEEFLSVFVGGLLAAMTGILRQWQLAGIGCKIEQKLTRWAMRLKGETENGNDLQQD
jgi:hypothetical protein